MASPPPTDPRTIVLLGIPFHDVTMEETLDWIGRMIRRGSPSFLVTANLDFATQAAKDVELQRILVEAELVICDGTPLVWASRLTGQPLRERVAGSDLVPRLAERASSEGWKLFLLGGEPASLEAASKNLAAQFPDLKIVGSYSPPFAKFHEMDHADLVSRIREARPDVLLVAFGCPKQEKWIYAHYRDLGVPCSIGVGATIDFLAGKVNRAPDWVGKLGLEWIYRAAQEPGRLIGRYAKDLKFLIFQMLRERKAILQPPTSDESARSSRAKLDQEDIEMVLWKGPILAGTLDGLTLPTYTQPFIIDLSHVTMIDSGGLGYLLRTLRRGWARGTVGCFSSASDDVKNILKVTRLDRVIPMAADVSDARELLSQQHASDALRPIVDSSDGSMLFSMPQELVAANASSSAAALTTEWANHPAIHTLRLDLSGTRFIDSSGLGLLIRCHRMVSERGASRLEILHPSDNVKNVIGIARLGDLLGVPK